MVWPALARTAMSANGRGGGRLTYAPPTYAPLTYAPLTYAPVPRGPPREPPP